MVGGGVALAHCSFVASPSDYTRGIALAEDGGGSADPDGGEGGAQAARAGRIVLVGGERDPLLAGELAAVGVADVWFASIDADGAIGRWSVGPSTPFRGPVMASLVEGATLFVVADDSSSSLPMVAVEWLTIGADGTFGAAWGARLVDVPDRSSSTRLLLPRAFASLGGGAFVPDEEGNLVFTRVADVSVSPFDPVARTFARRPARRSARRERAASRRRATASCTCGRAG